MSATIARPGGRVQLEQSDMRLALNMANMAKEGFLRAAIEEMQYLIKKSRAGVREEKNRGDEFPGHRKVKAAMERHPTMIHQNHTDGWLPCQSSTGRNPLTCWRRKGKGAHPPVWGRHSTPDPTHTLPATPSAPGTPSPPRSPPARPSPIQGTQRSLIDNLPVANTDSHVSLPKTQSVNPDAVAEDSTLDQDFDPELLTDERTSCG